MALQSLLTPQNAAGRAQSEQARSLSDEKTGNPYCSACVSSAGVYLPFSSESIFAKFEGFLRLKTNLRGYFAGLWANGVPNGGVENHLLQSDHFHWGLGCLVVNEDGQHLFCTYMYVHRFPKRCWASWWKMNSDSKSLSS